MKTRISVFAFSLLVLLLTGLPTPSLAAEANTVLNPSLEEMDPHSGLPAGWNWAIGNGSGVADLAVDDQVVHSGSHALRIRSNPDAAPDLRGAVGATFSTPQRYEPGETYTYSAYVKISNLKGKAYLQLFEYPAPFPSGTMHRSQEITGTTEGWQRLSITFTARPDIGNLQIRCVAYYHEQPEGTAWFDDVQIEEGPEATAFTDQVDEEYYSMQLGSFPLTVDYQVSTEYETPHAAPSRPSPFAPPSVLFALYVTDIRDAVELAQRMDMNMDTVPLDARPQAGHKIAIQCIRELRKQLQNNPGAFFMNDDTWNQLIRKDRRAILERVKQGAGLVLYDATGTIKGPVKDLVDATTDATTDRHRKTLGRQSTVCRYGDGVVVVLIRENNPETACLREQQFDRYVRALRVSLGHDTAPVETATGTFYPPAGRPWFMTASCPADAARSVRVRVRRNHLLDSGDILFTPVEQVAEQTVPLDDQGRASAELPPVAAGYYFLETAALDAGGKVLGWSFYPVYLETPFRIWSISSDRRRIEPGDPITASVRVDSARTEPAAGTLSWSVTDTEGRLLSAPATRDVELQPGANTASVEARIEGAVVPQARLEVRLLVDGAVQDERTLTFSTEALMRKPDFRFLIYPDMPRALKELGVDTVVTSVPNITDLGLRMYPWRTIMPGPENSTLERSDTVTSPATREKVAARIVAKLESMLPYYPVAMITVDEWSHHQLDEQREPDTVYFREYLRKTYESIADLNRSWRTDLASFDEVTLAMCDEKLIKTEGADPARWADRERMYEIAVAEFVGTVRDAARKVVPHPRLGLSGTRSPGAANGLDWWLLMQVQDSVASYDRIETRLQESFRSDITRLYQWSYPTRDNEVRSRHDPWRDLLKQRDGYLHYGGRHSDLIAPDFRPHPAAKYCAETVDAIRRGPARLIRASRRDDFGIGILYSQASYRAAHARSLTGEGPGLGVNDALTSTDRALGDMALDDTFYSYEQLERGDVTPDRVKVLFLSAALALSDREVVQLERYVKGGGVLIADVRPGLYDYHCHRRAAAPLDDVFGVGPVGDGLVMEEATLSAADPGLPEYSAELRVAEWDLQPGADAQTLGTLTAGDRTAPAIVVNRYGRGTAILLNFDYGRYITSRGGGVGGEVDIVSQEASAAPVRLYLAALLDRFAGIKPAARVLDVNGYGMPGVRLYTYRDGPNTYLGFVQDYRLVRERTTEGVLQVDLPGELYNVRTRRHLGPAGRHPITATLGVGQLYAVLPAKAASLKLASPTHVTLGQTLTFSALVRTGAKQPGRHVLVAELTRPDGTGEQWDRFTVSAPGGAGRGDYTFALNDPAGEWTLVLTDAVSGVSDQATITVTGGAKQ